METKYQQAAHALNQVGYETIVSDQNLKIRAVTLSLNAPMKRNEIPTIDIVMEKNSLRLLFLKEQNLLKRFINLNCNNIYR
jgi:hypothetical protein